MHGGPHWPLRLYGLAQQGMARRCGQGRCVVSEKARGSGSLGLRFLFFKHGKALSGRACSGRGFHPLG